MSIAREAVQAAAVRGVRARLVSMPCTGRFDAQQAAYREAVLPASVSARVAVEAGASGCWWRYVGAGGRVIGIDHYGASGKASDLFREFGFTPEHVLSQILESVQGTTA